LQEQKRYIYSATVDQKKKSHISQEESKNTPQDFTAKKKKTMSEIQDLKSYAKYASSKAVSPKLSELLKNLSKTSLSIWSLIFHSGEKNGRSKRSLSLSSYSRDARDTNLQSQHGVMGTSAPIQKENELGSCRCFG